MLEFHKYMTREAEQIKALQARSAKYASLAQIRSDQIPSLEQAMFDADSVEDTLRINAIISRSPAQIDRLRSKANLVDSQATSLLEKTRAQLAKMSGIPVLAEKYEAFKAELDALDPKPTSEMTTRTAAELDAIFPLAMPYPTFGFGTVEPEGDYPSNTTVSTTEGHDKPKKTFTKSVEFKSVLPAGIEFSTRSRLEHEILQVLTQGVTKADQLKQIAGSSYTARISDINRKLAAQGLRISSQGKPRTDSFGYSLEIIEITQAKDTQHPLEELPTEEAETTDPIGPEGYLEDDGLEATLPETLEANLSAEDAASLTAVRDAIAIEAKRGYVKTGPEDLYKRRDLTIFFKGKEITISNAPGFPAAVVDLIQAGVHTKTGIANAIYPENDPNGRGKVSTTINQGVARMLAPYNLTVINLTSQADQKKGVASNFDIIELSHEIAQAGVVTAESLTDESTETLEITDYEAGVVAILFDEPLIQEILKSFGINPLSKEAIADIQNYLPTLAPQNRPQNGEMNKIRINILTKLGDIYNQGIEDDIFDRSGIGAGILMEYFVGLDQTQRAQVLETLTAHMRKKIVGTHNAHRYGVVDTESIERQYADLGPEGRPAQPGESPIKAKRTKVHQPAPVTFAGIVRSGDIKTIEAQRARETQQLRDSRHRVMRQPQAPAYTDAIVAAGPQAIATARAEAVASTDLSRSQVAAVEAADILPRTFNSPPEKRVSISKEFDALRGFRFDFDLQIETLLDDILTNMPELASNPRGIIGPSRLTQVYNNLPTTTIDKYEEIGVIQVTMVGGRKNYAVASILSARFYREFDSNANKMSRRARKQLKSAIEKAVEARVAKIQSSASK